jgi:hypothetical protein
MNHVVYLTAAPLEDGSTGVAIAAYCIGPDYGRIQRTIRTIHRTDPARALIAGAAWVLEIFNRSSEEDMMLEICCDNRGFVACATSFGNLREERDADLWRVLDERTERATARIIYRYIAHEDNPGMEKARAALSEMVTR